MLGKEGQRITVQLTEWGMGRLFPLPSRIGSLGSFINLVRGRALDKDTFRHIFSRPIRTKYNGAFGAVYYLVKIISTSKTF